MTELLVAENQLKQIKLTLEVLPYEVKYSEISRDTAIRHTAAIASLLFYSPRTQRFLSYCQVPSGMVSIVCDLWHTARLEELLLKGQEIVVAPTIWIPIRIKEGDSSLVTLISGVLSSHSISIFYLSTETCDYFMIQKAEVRHALTLLQEKLTVNVYETGATSYLRPGCSSTSDNAAGQAIDLQTATHASTSSQTGAVQSIFLNDTPHPNSGVTHNGTHENEVKVPLSFPSAMTTNDVCEGRDVGGHTQSSVSLGLPEEHTTHTPFSPALSAAPSSGTGSCQTGDSINQHRFVVRLVQRTLYMIHYTADDKEQLIANRLLYCMFLHDSYAELLRSSEGASHETDEALKTSTSLTPNHARFFSYSDVDGSVSILVDRDQLEILAFGEQASAIQCQIRPLDGFKEASYFNSCPGTITDNFWNELERAIQIRKRKLDHLNNLITADDPQITTENHCQHILRQEAHDYVNTLCTHFNQANETTHPKSTWGILNGSGFRMIQNVLHYSPWSTITKVLFPPRKLDDFGKNGKQIIERAEENEFDWVAIGNTLRAADIAIDSWLATIKRQSGGWDAIEAWSHQLMASWTGQTWRCFQLDGDWGFEQTGVVYSLSRPITEAGICPMYMSTFRTDYLFVPNPQTQSAIKLLMDVFPVYPI